MKAGAAGYSMGSCTIIADVAGHAHGWQPSCQTSMNLRMPLMPTKAPIT
jgi:hypothetical protein